ncbi:unnamed protein product [Oikopleura dioica]|nr:unnamed protein product [Oikopleura dioica]
MQEKVEIPVCPDFGGFKLSKTPKYSFSSDKYLGHWLTHGPNNQIVDFRSGLFASIAMKRALLPPLFYFGL